MKPLRMSYFQGEDHDSSSLGSGGNDSLDSGGRSPADTMLGSEGHVEVRKEAALLTFM